MIYLILIGQIIREVKSRKKNLAMALIDYKIMLMIRL